MYGLALSLLRLFSFPLSSMCFSGEGISNIDSDQFFRFFDRVHCCRSRAHSFGALHLRPVMPLYRAVVV